MKRKEKFSSFSEQQTLTENFRRYVGESEEEIEEESVAPAEQAITEGLEVDIANAHYPSPGPSLNAGQGEAYLRAWGRVFLKSQGRPPNTWDGIDAPDGDNTAPTLLKIFTKRMQKKKVADEAKKEKEGKKKHAGDMYARITAAARKTPGLSDFKGGQKGVDWLAKELGLKAGGRGPDGFRNFEQMEAKILAKLQYGAKDYKEDPIIVRQDVEHDLAAKKRHTKARRLDKEKKRGLGGRLGQLGKDAAGAMGRLFREEQYAKLVEMITEELMKNPHYKELYLKSSKKKSKE